MFILVNSYEEIFSKIVENKKGYNVINNINDLSGELLFSYLNSNELNNNISCNFKLLHSSELKFLDAIQCDINESAYKKVEVYILLIENDIFIYEEGKTIEDGVKYYSKQSYFNYTFYLIINNICKLFKEKKLVMDNYFRIIKLKYGIDEALQINLQEIDINPDLSWDTDREHKIKLHYWIFFDLFNKFVFKNNLHGRWIKCEENMKMPEKNINRQKKYLINRSNTLKKILNKNGWVEGDINEPVDFSYWDVYDAKGVRVKSNISIFPVKITSIMDNKKSMYEILERNNLTSFLPKTYTNIDNIDKNIFNNDNLYFLKESGGSGGKAVTAINSYEQMTEIMSKKRGEYILQEEVPNMYLDNGYKTALRIYILITDELKIYIYKEAKVYIYKQLYSKNNLDNNIHNSTYNSNYEYFTEKDYYKIVFDKIKDICLMVTDIFLKNVKEKNRYQIMGYDFIIDKEFNPYLIEINTMPNLAAAGGRGIVQELNTRLINDFVNLYLYPKIDECKPIHGDWILCN